MAVSRLFWCKEHRIAGPLRAYADNDGHNFPVYGGIDAPADSAHADNDGQCGIKKRKSCDHRCPGDWGFTSGFSFLLV